MSDRTVTVPPDAEAIWRMMGLEVTDKMRAEWLDAHEHQVPAKTLVVASWIISKLKRKATPTALDDIFARIASDQNRLQRLEARVKELIEANTRRVEEARAARAEAQEFKDAYVTLCSQRALNG